MTAIGTKMLVPASIGEALALLSESPLASVMVGGGTHVMAAHFSQLTPRARRLIDVSTLEHFAQVSKVEDCFTLGPSVTYATVLDSPEPDLPVLLRRIASAITGGPQIRNQGTIGGSACYANPASDIPTGLVALGATLRLQSESRGAREVAASDFFTGAFRNALLSDEMLVGILVRRDDPRTRWGYAKLKAVESGWPLVVAAARLTTLDAETVNATVTVGAAAEKPFTLSPLTIEAPMQAGDSWREQLRACLAGVDARWWTDEQAEASYRRRVAWAVAARAIEDAFAAQMESH